MNQLAIIRFNIDNSVQIFPDKLIFKFPNRDYEINIKLKNDYIVSRVSEQPLYFYLDDILTDKNLATELDIVINTIVKANLVR